MTRAEFFAACQAHDWYYQFSDDHRVYTRGQHREDELRSLAESDPTLAAIFAAWRSYMFSGPTWGSERAPKPELSDFDV